MAKLCPRGKAAAYVQVKLHQVARRKIEKKLPMVVIWLLVQREEKEQRVRSYYSEGGLRKWVSEKWVDIGAPKKDGKYQPCGRSKGSKRKYPKCVPLAKATRMTKGQKASAVRRKRAAGNPGGKPTNVATFVKKKK